MKKKYFIWTFLALVLSGVFAVNNSLAYWIWTPEIGKWINPKYAVKSSPQEQFDWAMRLYEEKQYPKAADEFSKLVFNYSTSKYAPSALYYGGLCYEANDYYYKAYQSYDRILKEYPTFENIDEIIEREFKIGEAFLGGEKRKAMGMKIFPSSESAIEIFSSIAENAPFSKYGAQAQFKVGVALKKAGKYSLAKESFDKVILNYPDSTVVEQARYESADCSFLASGESAYEQTVTKQAIDEFNQLLSEEKDDVELSEKAGKKLLSLREKDAEHLYNIAKFYERIKKDKSAVIYYEEIIAKYPQTSFAKKAQERLNEREQNDEK
ncbi:MAG: outer membrane protein assembly factor BamD [Candidatus Omnitrophota bacterium]